jgi:hypothetical protein
VPRKHNGSIPTASGTITIYFLGLDTSEELDYQKQEMALCIYTKTILTGFLFCRRFLIALIKALIP